MSAFIVSHDHIDALVTYAIALRVSYRTPGDWVEVTFQNAEEVGNILLHENERSVRYRYPLVRPEELPGKIGENTASYSFRIYARPTAPVAIIKALHCIEYQSCEHPGWESSIARAVCQAIQAAALRELPGYDEANWEINRPAPAGARS